MRYEFRPLTAWTGPFTADRTPARRFSAAWQSTLDLLGRETELLGATLVVVQVDVAEADLRRDGMLRANARPKHPGVKISFESRFGPLTYATDNYDHWQANVRAIALGLEALRAVDRYGITKTGEQYRGFRAIEGAPSETMTADEAVRFLAAQSGVTVLGPGDTSAITLAYRRAVQQHHPDRGGDASVFRRLTTARDLLLGGGS
jgi:hypothetical protein